MTGKTIWLSGAAAAAFLVGLSAPNLAAANPIPPAATYADLLEPVPDASARLATDDAMRMQSTLMGAHLERTQYYYYDRHHHHHHHHHHSWHWYRDNGYYWNGNVWVIRPQYHHHHHHHSWQWYSDNGYYWNGWAWTHRSYRYHHHHHHHHHYYNRW